MKTVRYIYWQEGDVWLGYLEDFPDYQTQGESIQELQENLKDIFHDLTENLIPNVRHAGELQIV
jgi:predicted RNase H-like HicB family nuclease